MSSGAGMQAIKGNSPPNSSGTSTLDITKPIPGRDTGSRGAEGTTAPPTGRGL